MHVTIKDSEGDGYVELCLPTYSKVALIIRRHKVRFKDDVWENMKTIAVASGAKLLLDVSPEALEVLPEPDFDGAFTGDAWRL